MFSVDKELIARRKDIFVVVSCAETRQQWLKHIQRIYRSNNFGAVQTVMNWIQTSEQMWDINKYRKRKKKIGKRRRNECTSSRRLSHRPQGLSSRISLSSSESSPLSRGDLCSGSVLERLPGITHAISWRSSTEQSATRPKSLVVILRRSFSSILHILSPNARTRTRQQWTITTSQRRRQVWSGNQQ